MPSRRDLATHLWMEVINVILRDEAVFGTLYALDDPGVDNGDVFMLHEELLGADPSGLEGRPGSAGAAPEF